MTSKRDRPFWTWLEVLALVAGLGALVVVMDRALARPIPERWLRVVLALASAELLLIAAAIAVAVACKLWARWRWRRRVRVWPAVQAALSAHLAGTGDVAQLVALARRERALLEEGLEECLRAVTGEAHAGAVRLVAALGYLARWRDALGDRRAAARQRALTRLALLPAELRNDLVVAALEDADEGV